MSDALIKRLSQPYPSSTMVDLVFKGNDVSIKTNEDGNAMLAFIGKRGPDGNIRGERYARTLKYDRNGQLIKDHWERKGRAT